MHEQEYNLASSHNAIVLSLLVRKNITETVKLIIAVVPFYVMALSISSEMAMAILKPRN